MLRLSRSCCSSRCCLFLALRFLIVLTSAFGRPDAVLMGPFLSVSSLNPKLPYIISPTCIGLFQLMSAIFDSFVAISCCSLTALVYSSFTLSLSNAKPLLSMSARTGVRRQRVNIVLSLSSSIALCSCFLNTPSVTPTSYSQRLSKRLVGSSEGQTPPFMHKSMYGSLPGKP